MEVTISVDFNAYWGLTKFGCENIMSQNTIVELIGLIERLTF